jgi:hypothetical protein
MSNSTGYKGTMASAAAAFFAPYKPANLRHKTWQERLQTLSIYFNHSSPIHQLDLALKCMQKDYPGNYTMVFDIIDNRKLKLKFFTEQDEIWFYLKYD